MCKNKKCRNRKKYACIDRNGELKLRYVDSCLCKLLEFINSTKLSSHNEIRTLGSCCGHGIYTMTIVVKDRYSPHPYELLSGKDIPRTRNFYKRDKQGYYYIPEVNKEKP